MEIEGKFNYRKRKRRVSHYIRKCTHILTLHLTFCSHIHSHITVRHTYCGYRLIANTLPYITLPYTFNPTWVAIVAVHYVFYLILQGSHPNR